MLSMFIDFSKSFDTFYSPNTAKLFKNTTTDLCIKCVRNYPTKVKRRVHQELLHVARHKARY